VQVLAEVRKMVEL
jgi:hypothetical protein